MDISALTNQMTILFLISILGYAGIRLKWLNQDTNKVMADLVINIANPCTLLCSVLGGARMLTNQEVLMLTAVAAGSYVVAIFLGKLVPRILRTPKIQYGIYEFMTVFSNIGFIGIPVVNAMFGNEAVFLVAIFNLWFNLLCYTYGCTLMATRQEDKTISIRSFFTPITISSIAAYIFYLLGITAPPMVYDALSTVSGMTSPVAMLALGCALATVRLKDVFLNFRLYLFSILKLLVLPLMIYALTFWWMENQLMLGVTVTMWSLPVGSMVTMLAAKYDSDQGLPAAAVFMTTVLSIFTMPALFAWLF